MHKKGLRIFLRPLGFRGKAPDTVSYTHLIIEGEDIDFRITDISPLKIDYYYPRACEDKVDITVLIQDEHVKVYLSACEDLMNFNECAKVLSNIKSVINNPSLMLV